MKHWYTNISLQRLLCVELWNHTKISSNYLASVPPLCTYISIYYVHDFSPHQVLYFHLEKKNAQLLLVKRGCNTTETTMQPHIVQHYEMNSSKLTFRHLFITSDRFEVHSNGHKYTRQQFTFSSSILHLELELW